MRDHTFRAIDALVLPTAPTIYAIDEVLADPIGLNSRLGTYTNFVNLLDMCGLAVPAGIRPDGIVQRGLLAPAGDDAALAATAANSMPRPACRSARSTSAAAAGQASGCAGRGRNSDRCRRRTSPACRSRRIARRGGRLRAYRDRAALSALRAAGTRPPKPGLLRVEGARRAIEVEVWRFGSSIRPLRRRGAVSALDRHARTGQRPLRQGLPGRGRGGRRRARHFSFGGWRAFGAGEGDGVTITSARR